MKLIRRISAAKCLPARDYFYDKTRGVKGIVPELCPAVREFNHLGMVIFSPTDLSFLSSHEFEVEVRSKDNGDRILIPGVIGGPTSSAYYARVDSGFSLSSCQVPIMGIMYQGPGSAQKFLQIPSVVYPIGYVGPILIPISAYGTQLISNQVPLIHLIPMDQYHENGLVTDEPIIHPEFEGLLYEGVHRDYPNSVMVSSLELVPLSL